MIRQPKGRSLIVMGTFTAFSCHDKNLYSQLSTVGACAVVAMVMIVVGDARSSSSSSSGTVRTTQTPDQNCQGRKSILICQSRFLW